MNNPDMAADSGDADARAETEAEQPEEEQSPRGRLLSVVKEIVIVVVAALIISTLVKTFLFRAYVIPSGSMENTLQVQDRVFVNLLAPKPMGLHRGDVVVFEDEQGWLENLPDTPPPGPVADALTFLGLRADDSTQHLVKRVIGLPGDTVQADGDGSKLKVNGVQIDEDYLHPGSSPSDEGFKIVVPKGKLWVMGDHRDDSADSRAHSDKQGGFVDESAVEGRASLIAWPFDHFGGVQGPGDTFDQVEDRTPRPYDPDKQHFVDTNMAP